MFNCNCSETLSLLWYQTIVVCLCGSVFQVFLSLNVFQFNNQKCMSRTEALDCESGKWRHSFSKWLLVKRCNWFRKMTVFVYILPFFPFFVRDFGLYLRNIPTIVQRYLVFLHDLDWICYYLEDEIWDKKFSHFIQKLISCECFKCNLQNQSSFPIGWAWLRKDLLTWQLSVLPECSKVVKALHH